MAEYTYTKNIPQSTLASGYTAGNTTITVQSGDGAKFDTAPFVVAVGNPPAFFLHATGKSTDTFTVDASGFDGSTPISVTAATPVTQVVSAGVLSAMLRDAGALKLLEEHTASTSAHLDFTSWYSSAYDTYLIEIIGIVNASSGNLGIRCSTDGGSTYDSGANYAWQATFSDTTGAAGESNSADSALNFFATSSTPATNLGWYASLRLYNPLATSSYPMFLGCVVNPYSGASVMHKIDWGGYYASLTPVNALRILNTAGNLTSGTVRIYGLSK